MNNLRLIAFIAIGGCSSAPAPATPTITDNQPAPPVAASVDRSEKPATECRGDSLDLVGLALSHRCDVGGTASALPPAIEVALATPALQATSGSAVAGALTLTNQGEATARLTLDASCRFGNLTDVELYSEADIRLDHVGVDRCSEPPAGCAGHVVEVWLDPGGVATIPFEFPARVAVADSKTCESHPGRALAAGRYRAVVKSSLVAEPFEATLRVKAIRNLPLRSCASYANKLAKKAEPDPARRPEVAAEVARQCRRDPPRQALVDCQLGAKTEAELAACKNN